MPGERAEHLAVVPHVRDTLVDLTTTTAPNAELRRRISDGDEAALIELARREFDAEVLKEVAA